MKVALACFVMLALIAAPTTSVAQQSQPLPTRIRVELPFAQHASSVPDADNQDAWIVTITDSGSLYFGLDPTTTTDLAGQIPRSLSSRGQRLYIKADARAQYVSVEKVLEAVREAGIEAPILLTDQPEWSKPGTALSPKGLAVLIDPSASSGSGSVTVEMLNSEHRRPLVKINDRQVSWSNLHRTLNHTLKNKAEKVVLVKADGFLRFADIVHVIDVCRENGANPVLAVVVR